LEGKKKMKQYSEILRQNIYINKEIGLLKTQDGTIYKGKELLLLKDVSNNSKMLIHRIKNIFNGEIVK
jgi:hypothetical protein